MARRLLWAASALSISLGTLAFEAPIKDTDYTRQLCSGMYSSESTYINVTFDQGSQGQLAMVIYEWGDYKYLGKVTSEEEEWLPVCALSLNASNAAQRRDPAENICLHLRRCQAGLLLTGRRGTIYIGLA